MPLCAPTSSISARGAIDTQISVASAAAAATATPADSHLLATIPATLRCLPRRTVEKTVNYVFAKKSLLQSMASSDSLLLHIAELPASSVAVLYKVYGAVYACAWYSSACSLV